MLKALRESTRKQRVFRSEDKLELHKVKKKPRKSIVNLVTKSQRVEISEDSLVTEIRRLSSLFSIVKEKESQDNSYTGSSHSLDWDNQVDVESPLKDEDNETFDDQFVGSLLPPAQSKFRSVSVSVNRVNYIEDEEGRFFDLQPVCRSLNSQFEDPLYGVELGLISQDTILERNLQLRSRAIIEQIEEADGIEGCLENIENKEEIKMEPADYAAKLKAVKLSARKVAFKIGSFNADDVTILDKDNYEVKLTEIRRAQEGFHDDASALLDQLVEVRQEDAARIQEVSTLIDEIAAKVKQNEKEVKKEVVKVIAEYESSKPLSKGEIEATTLKKEKLLKRFGFLKENATDLKLKLLKVKKVKDMTDTEIRMNMSEIKDWEKNIADLNLSRQKADEDSVGLRIESSSILNMQETVQDTIDAISAKVENLRLEDRTRGLFSTVKKHVPKESIVFPEEFSGKYGEDVFKFTEKMEQAIFDSQIREKDRVEVLRKHLKGNALEVVGKHYTDFDKAKTVLIEYFGQSERIWEQTKKDIVDNLGGDFKSCWGSIGSSLRIKAIVKTLEFLKMCKEMAESHSTLENEIYNSSTYKMVIQLLPSQFISKFHHLIGGHEVNYRDRMESLSDFLEQERVSALEDERVLDYDQAVLSQRTSPSGGGDQQRQRGAVRRTAAYGGDKPGPGSDSCEYCQSKVCRKEWGALGCIELFKLVTIEERLTWLKERDRCFRCGEKYSFPMNSFHSCKGGKGKILIKCTVDGCRHSAVTCRSHNHNFSQEVVKWIKSTKIPTKHLSMIFVFNPSSVGSVEEVPRILASNKWKDKKKSSSIPNNREKLQSGEVVMEMSDDELVPFFEEDMKKISRSKPDVRGIPEGDAMFVMCVFKGRTRPVLAFIDSGCNCWVSAADIPANELIAVKLREGPIPMGVASGITVNASAEWAALLPLEDGGQQVVRGLTMPQVTQDMPRVNMQKVFDVIKKSSEPVPAVQNLKVPKWVGGRVDMIIGIKYQNICPELVHQYPNGLAVYKSKLLPCSPGAVACVGGPVAALDSIVESCGGHSALGYMTQLTLAMGDYKTRIDFFPTDRQEKEVFDLNIQDLDLLGLEEMLIERKVEESEEILANKVVGKKRNRKNTKKDKDKADVIKTSPAEIACAVCGDKEIDDVKYITAAVQSEIDKFMKMQEAGLETSFRCSKCRDCENCMKGSGFERISLKQEAEQELIKESVYIDRKEGKAMARLPFKADPKQFLADNNYVAQKRLQNICKKYFKEESVRTQILAAFEKLRKRGHIKHYEDLTEDQRKKLESAESSYTIPWDVQFKGNSISTPIRTVLDASSKTSTGFSLNDILAIGLPNLVLLIDVLLEWQVGPVAFVGDVSQFYPSVGLEEESWPFQKIIIRENLNPDGRLIKAVIVACIFGVCSSGGQSEEVCRRLSEEVKDEFPEVARLLTTRRYVDDILKSLRNMPELLKLIPDTEKVLKEVGMEVKGWGISKQKPPEQLTEDGVSIGLPYKTWYTEIDHFKLNISSLHFGKKKRGRFSPDLEIFDANNHKTIENFVEKKIITRRNCTSVVARIPDLLGRVAPLTLRFKHDLRKLIEENPGWDDPISARQRLRWIENFKMIEDVRDILYARCPIPENALSLKARIWILCDAADGGIMVAVYAGFELPDNRWSCSNLLGKGLLSPEEWTIPKKELQALNNASNVKVVVERALNDWIGEIYIGGDSEIALAWCIYENVKLNVFHRNRVNNIRAKVGLNQLHHVLGPENPSDTGTRPDAVSACSVLPGSEWLCGKEWMKKSYQEAVAEGIVKSVKDIKLTNDAKKVMKEGVIFDTFEDEFTNVAVALINTIDIQKVAERESFSNYIFPPLKRSFRPTVRIVSMVLLAVKKFKRGGLNRKIRTGKADISEIENFENDYRSVKFTTFQLSENNEGSFDQYNKEQKLTEMFMIEGVVCNLEQLRNQVLIRLTVEDISQGLEYLYKKATQEIMKFENKKDIEKISVMKDDILFCSSRILESQKLRAVGCLSETIDLESFTGIKFFVPLVSKHSPLAVSLAIHIHYNVKQHTGVESTYRTSLQHVRILQGKQIFKEVSDDCLYCKKLRLKYTKQLMGPLSDSQLSISPIFYFAFMDMWGPIQVYCPGYEKNTRARKMEYEVHMLVIGCAVTGAINCQIIEKKDAGAVLDGLNRFFCEVSVPKVAYPDKDGALMRALTHGEIDLVDLQGRLYSQRGIHFEICLPQGHYSHGRIERRIRMIQESLDRSDLRNSRNTATGWQTISKLMERQVNNIPLGYLYHQGTANPLLKVLCPSLLKNGTFSDRAPTGVFNIPDSVEELMDKTVEKYNMWFRIWNTEYVPLIMDRQKWHQEGENLKVNDLVYFKLTDSALAADWRLGKVEFVTISRDGLVREVGISYKYKDFDDDTWSHNTVERPVKAVVKLCNIEDTSILEDMAQVKELVEKILKGNEVPIELGNVDGPEADDTENFKESDGEFFNDITENEFVEAEFEDVKEVQSEQTKQKRRRKTELEKLKIESKEFEFPPEGRRKKPVTLDSMEDLDKRGANHYTATVMAFVANSQEQVEVTSRTLNMTMRPSRVTNRSLCVTTSSGSIITWPEFIQNGNQVGVTTAALLGGVTGLVAGGARVLCGEEPGWFGRVEAGISENDFDKHCLYLM